MAKQPPRDHDATMDLSLSQLVVDPPVSAPVPAAAPAKPRPAPPAAGANNDRSMWAYQVVGTDEFAPKPRIEQGPRARIWLVILLILVLAAAATYLVAFRL